MKNSPSNNLLWWLIPGVLAGMPMPFIHPDRRLRGGASLTAFNDELAVLGAAGVRAVVSLLNQPRDAQIYEPLGCAFLCLPVPDGYPPTPEQVSVFVRFVDAQRAESHPVAVHCAGGIGRTGTMLAAYLISQGADADTAITRVRAVEPAAIETSKQIAFLDWYAQQKPS
jgi:atypical dual specificity phosphatase